MKFPKKIVKSVVAPIIMFWIISIILVFTLGFETARKILGFVGSIIGLPTAFLNLSAIIYSLDEGKLINRVLINAREKDQKKWEKAKKDIRNYDK